MAWQNIGSVDFSDGTYASYGTMYLQYDDSSSGATRPCRIQYVACNYCSAYIYVRDLYIGGNLVTGQDLINGSSYTSGSANCNPGSVSATFTCPWNNGTRYYTITGTLPSAIVNPSGLSSYVYGVGKDYVTLHVEVSSWGTPSNNANRYLEGAVLEQASYGAPYRYRLVPNNGMSGEVRIDNTSSTNASPSSFKLVPNTKYWYGVFASNGGGGSASYTSASQIVATYPDAPTATNFQVNETTASFDITETSAGTSYPVQLKYRYKKHESSSWSGLIDAGSAGNNQTVAVNLTGLDPDSSYDVRVLAYLVGSPLTSSNNTLYENAFTTPYSGIAITSETEVFNSQTNKIDHTINYSISGTGTSSTQYDIKIRYKKSSSSSWQTITTTNTGTTGSYTITGLDLGTSYDFEVSAKRTSESTYGEATTWTTTTNSYEPTVTIVEADSKFRSPYKDAFDLKTNAYPGNSSTATATVSLEAWNSLTSAWETMDTSTFYVVNGSVNHTESFFRTLAGSSTAWRDVSKYTKIRCTVTVTNSYNISATAQKEFPNEWPVVGQVIAPNNVRKNIVGIAFKDSSGNMIIRRGSYQLVRFR